MHYVVHYENGVTLVINKEVYERGHVYNGQPVSFLKYVEFMGKWTSIEKVD